jgi:formate dehydrogenase maturation protein FdhE
MYCPECRSDDSMEIEITLRDADPVRFLSCRRCETKWWLRDGEMVSLDDVLDLANPARDTG